MNFINFSSLMFAYLLGSINSAILICYIFNIPSPRSVGSCNPGTTNVLRIGGKIPASLTLIFDILKGLLPMLISKKLIDNEFIISCLALYIILGHVFPVFFNFKGGKGVATLIGILFGFRWIIGLIFVMTWLFVAIITRYSSLSSMIATVVAICSVILISSILSSVTFIAIAIIILIKHKSNIQNLIASQETKIGETKVTNDEN